MSIESKISGLEKRAPKPAPKPAPQRPAPKLTDEEHREQWRLFLEACIESSVLIYDDGMWHVAVTDGPGQPQLDTMAAQLTAAGVRPEASQDAPITRAKGGMF